MTNLTGCQIWRRGDLGRSGVVLRPSAWFRVIVDASIGPLKDRYGEGLAGASEVRRRLELAIWIRAGLANIGGAVPLVVLGGEYVRRFTPRYAELPLFWTGLAMTIVLFMPMWVTLRIQTRRLLAAATTWIDADEQPTVEERRFAARLAQRIGLLPAPWWATAVVLAVVIIHLLGVAPSAAELIVGVAGIVLGGVVSCGLCYLLAEDALRPLFRLVLADESERHGALGVRTRLVLHWVVGSGAYLLGIALILINFPPTVARSIGIVCCALGAVVGAITTNLSAASITRPLDRLRAGMQRVEAGELEVTVDVDDPGDVGLLQSGFNRMVAGLRERDRLRELFGRHVGAEVARRALETSVPLEGHELTASVLFADTIGSTSLAAEQPPEAIVAMLNAFFGSIVKAVGAEDGFVNQFQGDGAMCIFGAPNEIPDHAERAMRAARAICAEIVRLGEVYPGFDAGVGVSSGRVVAGDVGSEDRHDYTVIGDAVNEAARLCDEAKHHDGRVLVSEQTMRYAPDTAGWSACGEIALRGRPRPTAAFVPD